MNHDASSDELTLFLWMANRDASQRLMKFARVNISDSFKKNYFICIKSLHIILFFIQLMRTFSDFGAAVSDLSE